MGSEMCIRDRYFDVITGEKEKLATLFLFLVKFVMFCLLVWWTLDSCVLATHCVQRHQNGGLLLSLLLQAYNIWLRFGLQLDCLTSSVDREQESKAKSCRFDPRFIHNLFFLLRF